MSVPPVGTFTDPALYPAQRPSGTSNSKATAATSPAQSDRVTLSADAQAVAKLNAAGVTVRYVNISAALGSSNAANFAQQFAAVAQALKTSVPVGGVISKTAFEAVTAQYGATSSQVDQDFKAIDGDGNGVISNSELLHAFGQTNSDQSTPLSQDLLTLMDRNKDSLVSGTELINFESSAVDSEQA